jgi:hypothetical protein
MDRGKAIMGELGWRPGERRDEYFRPVQPDGVLDIADAKRDVRVMVEYDRTRRVDKNLDKFLRHETLLVVGGERPPSDARTSCSSARTLSTAAASCSPPTARSPATAKSSLALALPATPGEVRRGRAARPRRVRVGVVGSGIVDPEGSASLGGADARSPVLARSLPMPRFARLGAAPAAGQAQVPAYSA